MNTIRRMYPDPDEQPSRSKAIRRAPVAGEVVSRQPRPGDDDFDDGPSEDDLAKLDSPTRRCPACGKEVFDDTDVCYHCNHSISREPKGLSKLQIAVVLLIVGAFLFAALASMF